MGLDNGTTPFDEETKMKECPNCLGTKEVYESDDEEGLTGEMIPCTVCDGTGEIPDDSGFTSEEDYLDDKADMGRDDYMFNGTD
jgi:DnaJ-class molecular chaperone